uniref:Peptidase M12B domain-containing protein n=1 Tax=Rhabditophanes sp. KR3021 TaxID=114890 RepID=A0AC35TW99_9BILA
MNTNQTFHHHLSKRELLNTFGVEDHHKVPNYHYIQPDKVLDLTGHKLLKFKAFNQTYLIKLQPNHALISHNLTTVIRDGNEAVTTKGLPYPSSKHCHYIGEIVSHQNRKAALSDCAQLTGTLVMEDHFVIIQTVPQRIKRSSNSSAHHLVFKRDASLMADLLLPNIGEVMGHKMGEIKIDLQVDNETAHEEFCEVNQNLIHPVNYSIPPEAKLDSLFIFPQLDPMTLEIALFLDAELYKYFKREFVHEPEQHLMDFSLALINNVHVLYQQPNLSPNLEIVIVRYEMWKKQPKGLETPVHRNGQAQTLLDSFCRYQSRINPGTDLTDSGHWDHGVLLTGYDIYHTTKSVAGVAPVARMCDEIFSCSLVEGLHLGRSFVLAHEMGHNMGMVHDGVQNQCGRSCCLMSAVNGAGKTTWSPCSAREFNAFLKQLDESGRGNCLRDPALSIRKADHLEDGRLPGQRFTIDQQCSYFWGTEYQVEIPNGRRLDDICRILWCGNNSSLIVTAHPALDGSWCGSNKWCQEGKCRRWNQWNAEEPSVIHGKWSKWFSKEEHCPISPCQITGSISIRSQIRTCTDPAPNNGGRSCQGSNIRGIICGVLKSGCKRFDKQQHGDQLCSALKNEKTKPDKQLSGVSFAHAQQPCKVWCHLSDSELIRNKGQFPNGSPCGSGRYCVGGNCLKLSCNMTALVDNEKDCPAQNNQDRIAKGNEATWKEWTEWNKCTANCGTNGVQKRARTCREPKKEVKQSGKSSKKKTPKELSMDLDALVKSTTAVATVKKAKKKKAPKKVKNIFEDLFKIRLKRGAKKDEIIEEMTCFGDSEQIRPCLPLPPPCQLEPIFKDWQEWTECSKSCGSGTRKRSRVCVALTCAGINEETEDCNLTQCKKSIESWSDWLPCSVSTGIGFQLREKLCDGKSCPVQQKQAKTCNIQGHGRKNWKVSQWGDWSSCDKECGEGSQKRSRECSLGSCPVTSSFIQEKRCILRPCDIGLTSEWTSCSSCNVFEIRTRERTCKRGECVGSTTETSSCAESCQILYKDVENYENWQEWTPCSVTCGGGIKQRTRNCKPDKDCNSSGLSFDLTTCNEQSCEGTNNWSPWSEFGPCDRACGGGIQRRIRKCKATFVFQCDGSSRDERTCNEQSCSILNAAKTSSIEMVDISSAEKVDLDLPQFSEWSPFSSCSCSSRTQFRRRYCMIKDPSVQGFCAGPITETKNCEPLLCASVNGEWSEFSPYSKCSVQCGSERGHQIRNRMCANPLPSNRGSYCTGYSFEQKSCEAKTNCSGNARDGSWNSWTEWSICSDCSNGYRSRTRYCNNPPALNGGALCKGSDFEMDTCATSTTCQQQSTTTAQVGLEQEIEESSGQEDNWNLFSNFSECNNECGYSYKFKQRICKEGKKCEGDAYEMAMCAKEPCKGKKD